MKKKDKYKLINYAIANYNKELNSKYTRKRISANKLLRLLDNYKHSSVCEWNYCCYGMYRNCWQEPIYAGNWGWTQESVNYCIRMILNDLRKPIKRDERVAMYEDEIGVHVVIVARDLPQKTDYLFTFTNKED